ncbi:hypothetical protein BJ508DRAFT_322213 [Ascobolus immersus RN42]|uniref:Uncharacterized protein n=1 Tax=Ascobolus immersus RN42 TaxID=1160509 RepID=A0A3N4IIU9_ASCIM|nr:hypothetical protein BJ508DRAFT_322213 [Ascobolus immersus RN42]
MLQVVGPVGVVIVKGTLFRGMDEITEQRKPAAGLVQFQRASYGHNATRNVSYFEEDVSGLTKLAAAEKGDRKAYPEFHSITAAKERLGMVKFNENFIDLFSLPQFSDTFTITICLPTDFKSDEADNLRAQVQDGLVRKAASTAMRVRTATTHGGRTGKEPSVFAVRHSFSLARHE